MNQEELVAKQIVQVLDESVARLDTGVKAKLASSRQQAVSLMSQRSVMAAQNHHGVLSLFGGLFQGRRLWLSAGMFLGVVLIVFIVLNQGINQDSTENGDAFLLGEELPPEAFLDQGFSTWIAQKEQL